MKRLNGFLLVLLLGACLVTIDVSHEVRRLYAELDRARNQARRLELDYERIKAEAQSQSTPARVEAVARDRLGMSPATPAVTAYIQWGEGGAR